MNEVVEFFISLFIFLIVLSILLAYEYFFMGRMEALDLFKIKDILGGMGI